MTGCSSVSQLFACCRSAGCSGVTPGTGRATARGRLAMRVQEPVCGVQAMIENPAEVGARSSRVSKV
jgi:hypothetical protein